MSSVPNLSSSIKILSYAKQENICHSSRENWDFVYVFIFWTYRFLQNVQTKPLVYPTFSPLWMEFYFLLLRCYIYGSLTARRIFN